MIGFCVVVLLLLSFTVNSPFSCAQLLCVCRRRGAPRDIINVRDINGDGIFRTTRVVNPLEPVYVYDVLKSEYVKHQTKLRFLFASSCVAMHAVYLFPVLDHRFFGIYYYHDRCCCTMMMNDMLIVCAEMGVFVRREK